MPAGTRPNSMLPPEPTPRAAPGIASSASPPDIEVFERAFAAAEAATPQADASLVAAPGSRGLVGLIAGIGGAVLAALERWAEPRCASC